MQVWGQVRSLSGGDGIGVHPDDVLVEFFSHSDQYAAHVRRDRVVVPDALPDFVRTCTALRAALDGTLHRCIHHEHHDEDNHQSADGVFFGDGHDAKLVGYIEEA